MNAAKTQPRIGFLVFCWIHWFDANSVGVLRCWQACLVLLGAEGTENATEAARLAGVPVIVLQSTKQRNGLFRVLPSEVSLDSAPDQADRAFAIWSWFRNKALCDAQSEERWFWDCRLVVRC